MTPDEMYELILLALCVWRESRGESNEGKRGVAWVIRNRAMKPSWWGNGFAGVILKPLQFSSFNANDPNSSKLPPPTEPAWGECLKIAVDVFQGTGEDPTHGATHYFDDSIAAPSWTKNMTPLLKVGRLNFFREA